MGLTLVLKMKSLPKESLSRYIKGMAEELVRYTYLSLLLVRRLTTGFMKGAAVALLGLGACIHGDLIHAPPALKNLARLQCTGMLEDFESVMRVVQDTSDGQEDPHLIHYTGDWWTAFHPDTPAPEVDLSLMFDWWVSQREICPKPVVVPRFASFNLSHMVARDLKALEDIVRKMRVDIETDIRLTREELTRLCVCIAETKMEILRLEKKEAEAVEAEVKRACAQPSHG
ncbi:hypothetical protein FA13DRAFT_1705457 [Coprinellus micaceus]|uniref:Uncharacterized protein n=1 Tax=Coprinellus micaceus TaxID=71717 RepID=A0A4Y7TT48_COPMI|nr:hypothetical protein FA13DRAFT_1705457 [Coprinellus micaceus]